MVAPNSPSIVGLGYSCPGGKRCRHPRYFLREQPLGWHVCENLQTGGAKWHLVIAEITTKERADMFVKALVDYDALKAVAARMIRNGSWP